MTPNRLALPRPLIVELVGPAGAGKSAVAERLVAAGGVLRASVWNLPRALILESTLRSLPLLVRLCVATRRLPGAEMKQIVRLAALRLLVRRRAKHARLVVLDEGPVFALSWLRVFGHAQLQNGRLDRWWRSVLADWAAGLDCLVLLDAPESVLLSRLRGRQKPNDVFRYMNDPDVVALVARYRAAFDRVIGALTAGGGPRVLKLGTAEASLYRLGEAVLALVDEAERG
jgi:hypothetical protein